MTWVIFLSSVVAGYKAKDLPALATIALIIVILIVSSIILKLDVALAAICFGFPIGYAATFT